MSAVRPIIEVEDLHKNYALLPVLRGLDFTVARGEFVLLLGANGSGKSTLLRLLSGLSKPSRGAIYIGGWQMPQEAMAARAQIGLVAHQPLLYANLTARENLDFYGKLYGLGAAERARRSAELLQALDLQKRADSLTRNFSRGLRQRLSIARALLPQPALLLLDEPSSGLDQAASALLEALLRVALQEGRTIIMSTHQLTRLPTLASRALILSRGKIGFDGPITTDNLSDMTALYRQATAPLPA